MDFFLLCVSALTVVVANRYEQAQRIALLGGELSKFQIEKLMETTADGYLRAVGEVDTQRRAQIWNMLEQAQTNLLGQIQTFATAFAKTDAQATRFSTLPAAVPFATLLPFATADMRALVTLHAQGISACIAACNAADARSDHAMTQRDRAYMLTAELLLFQHSCHWFCRSKLTANARMMARHKTPHAQLLDAVSAQTRKAYQELLGIN